MNKNKAFLNTVVLAALTLSMAIMPFATKAGNPSNNDPVLTSFHAHHPLWVRQGNAISRVPDVAVVNGMEIPVEIPSGHGSGGGGGITNTTPNGLSPAQVRTVYNLPSTGGAGTIAIIDAYDDPNAAKDLNAFSLQFGLPSANFEKVKAIPRIRSDQGWALEESLDIEWAHAVAPDAKILLVEAKSASGNDLLSAVNYAASRSDVVAISMSWGGSEFSGESSYDSYFTGANGNPVTFFASSGDSGSGVEWPAVSNNVIGVGGTTLSFNTDGTLNSETAWSGSGGGLSAYESEPTYQSAYGVPSANGMRAVPDVSYDADPNSGVSVYDSYGYNGQSGWFVIGGTSAGAPQWAAIKALGGSVSNTALYTDAAFVNYSTYFRDITSGTNGSCGFYCTAATAYDYVTGLGSPLTAIF